MPTTTISPAVHANLAASNMAVAARAARQRREMCQMFVTNYRHKDATAVEMRQYSSCIHTLYPAPVAQVSRGEKLGVGLAAGLVGGLVAGLVIMVIGLLLEVAFDRLRVGDLGMRWGAIVVLAGPVVGLIAGAVL